MPIAYDGCQQKLESLKCCFVMTVDVDPPIPSIPDPLIIENGVSDLLRLFNKYDIKATFFVPAVVATEFPEVMEEIVNQRHEIACHGFDHDPKETTSGLTEELQIIKKATEAIQSVTGVRPVGFRAPLFKVNENCWFALQKNGYVYDSSVVNSPFYGDHKLFFPSKPFPLFIPKTNGKCLIEIPISANPLSPVPIGGNYVRILGPKWGKVGVKLNFMSQAPVMFYIHPKDVIPRTYGRNWYSYRNTSNCLKTVDEILKYAKKNGAKFFKAIELAKLFERDFQRRMECSQL